MPELIIGLKWFQPEHLFLTRKPPGGSSNLLKSYQKYEKKFTPFLGKVQLLTTVGGRN